MLVSDTVKVGKDTAAVLTDGCTKLKDVVMELEVCGDNLYSIGLMLFDEQDEDEPVEAAPEPVKKK